MPDMGSTYPTWEKHVTAPAEPAVDTTQAPAQPTQQPPAPTPVPTPAQVFPSQQQPQQPAPAARPVGDNGYPENTPLVEMTPAEQANYWRHQARKHENTVKSRADYDDLKAKAAEFDKLQAATMTETQRAVAEAEQRARSAALTEAGGRIAESALRTSLKLAKGMDDAEIERIVGPLNCNYFLTGDGLSVDTDKVTAYVATIAAPAQAAPAPTAAPAATPPAPVEPATGTPKPRPDMGQGSRTVTASGGLAAGAEIARARLARRQGNRPEIAK